MYSFDQLKPLLLNSNLSEGKLIKGIHQIQHSFTKELERRDEYISERDLVSAYSSFYFPTNFVKLEWGFSHLPESFVEQLGKTHLIDFGCGPGTFGLAWLEFFKKGNVTFIDQSDLMLKQAKAFLRFFHPNTEATFSKTIPLIEGPITLLFGNSLNEISLDDAHDIIERVRPDHVLFIEPGTKLVYQQLITLRKKLNEKGYMTHYPCLGDKDCPITKNDWCHQVMRTKHHDSIERLSQKAKIDRRTMPLTFHVYSKEQRTGLYQGRIIQFLRESKFSFDYKVCMGESIVEIQLLKKSLSKKQQKVIKETNVGQEIKFEVVKKVNDELFKAQPLLREG